MAVIILEDLDFRWEPKDIENVKKLWNMDMPVPDIAKKINRSTDETFLLLMHLSRLNHLPKRKGYFWGGNRDIKVSSK